MSKPNSTKVTNIASSVANEVTDFAASVRGAKTTEYISSTLKRVQDNGKISRVAGLVSASPSAAQTVKQKRAAKLAMIQTKAKLEAQEVTITNLEARVVALEAKFTSG